MIALYHAVSADPGEAPAFDLDWFDDEHEALPPSSFSDGPFDWERAPDDQPASSPPSEPPPQLGALPWVTCQAPSSDSQDGGWREGTYPAIFAHGIPPRVVACMPVIGSPIILHTGERLSELQAHAEVVAVLEVVGENLQQRLDAMPGSFTYSDSVICNMLKSDLNAAFRSQGRGYRARSGVPCVFR